MKLKLNHEEINVLIYVLEDCEAVRFNTHFESKICGVIIRDFLKSIMKKSIDMQAKNSFKLDDQTVLVLNEVLPQLHPAGDYAQALMVNIITQINQRCLSISSN